MQRAGHGDGRGGRKHWTATCQPVTHVPSYSQVLKKHTDAAINRYKGKVGGIKVQVVDTTGAGDAFCAGLFASLVKDFGIIDDEPRLREALKFANACGAITTTERGAIPSMPDRDTVTRVPRRPSAAASLPTDPSWQGYQRWRSRSSTTTTVVPR